MMPIHQRNLSQVRRAYAASLLAIGWLFGSAGCSWNFDIFRPPTLTLEEIEQARLRLEELRRQVDARAAQGDPHALVLVANQYRQGPKKDHEKVHYLERATASGAGVGLTALGIDLLTSTYQKQPRELERLRGLNLLRQAAIQGCRFGGLNSSLLPHPYLADYLEVTDPEESDLWRARNILHCGASVHGLRTRITTKNATPVQFATEGLAWQLLAKPDIAFESQRKNWPHADYIAAGQRAERLRRAVQESEKDFPPPPLVR
jgi:hypothetical protein